MKNSSFLPASSEWLKLSRDTNVMRYYCHVTERFTAFVITIAAWMLGAALDLTSGNDVHLGMCLKIDGSCKDGQTRVFDADVDLILNCVAKAGHTTGYLGNTARSILPTTQHPPEEEMCCSGVLGYASNNLSLNYPCQRQPCCNSSDTVAVVAIDFAMGFLFQCMPRKNVQPLCYETGAEVRTTNQDPDFIPRACCPGAKFKILVNEWYAAMVVKCVEENDDRAS